MDHLRHSTHAEEGSSQFPVATETYGQALNVAALANGPYEFRAIAEDRDGNVAVSQPVRGITVAHASSRRRSRQRWAA